MTSCMDMLELDKFIEAEDASNTSAINRRRSARDIFPPRPSDPLSCRLLLAVNAVLIFCASRMGVDILSSVSKMSRAVELRQPASVIAGTTPPLLAEDEARDDEGREKLLLPLSGS